jgi:aryl-alcohol dehydrogenase-like predicted oxidoreductase
MKYLDVDGIGRVNRIGLGTWQFGSREWGYGDGYAAGAARDIVHRARALDVNFFDTAEVYGLGKSERILGEALGDERDQVAVASKIFPVAPSADVPRNVCRTPSAADSTRPQVVTCSRQVSRARLLL